MPSEHLHQSPLWMKVEAQTEQIRNPGRACAAINLRSRTVGAGHFKNIAQPVPLFEIEDPNRRTAQTELDPK